MPLINRYTGQEATPKQLEACRRHAERILASPYSAPEQVQWAIEVPGVDIDGWFWESSQQRGIRTRRQAAITAQIPDVPQGGVTMANDIRHEGNLIIWQVNRDYRHVWEIDPIGGAVVSFSKEHHKVHRGRGHWVSRSEEIWSNPDFAGPHPRGTMAECPEVPAEARG